MLEELIKSCRAVQPVSRAAAEAYAAAAGAMQDHVNGEMESNPDTPRLIGNNPLDLMRNNHANHAKFMSAVFLINSYELLVRTIPWVYRAYHARGFSYDYFPVELAAWKNAAEKHLAPAQAGQILPVYDWMIQQHEGMIRLSQTGEGLSFSVSSETAEMRQIFLALLLHGDSRGCLQLAEQSIHNVKDVRRFYLDVVHPALYKIGQLWEENEVSVAEEHLATAIVGRVMAALYPRFASADLFRGKAVVTASPNELHEIGARMVADFLEFDGWDVSYLGASTPAEEIQGILKLQKPLLLALSVATVFNLDHARQVIHLIRDDRELRATKIMVGGLAFNNLPDIWREFGADGYAGDCNGAVLQANAWWAERSA